MGRKPRSNLRRGRNLRHHILRYLSWKINYVAERLWDTGLPLRHILWCCSGRCVKRLLTHLRLSGELNHRLLRLGLRLCKAGLGHAFRHLNLLKLLLLRLLLLL